MPDKDKTFSGSFVLDLRIWWRQAHALYNTMCNLCHATEVLHEIHILFPCRVLSSPNAQAFYYSFLY